MSSTDISKVTGLKRIPICSDDVATARCRLHVDVLTKLALFPGDPMVVKIQGQACLCSVAQLPAQYGEDIVQFDDLLRLPLPPTSTPSSSSLSDDTATVAATKNFLGQAKQVTLQLDTDMPAKLRNEVKLLLKWRVVCVGCTLSLGSINTVKVTRTEPANGFVRINNNTSVTFALSSVPQSSPSPSPLSPKSPSVPTTPVRTPTSAQRSAMFSPMQSTPHTPTTTASPLTPSLSRHIKECAKVVRGQPAETVVGGMKAAIETVREMIALRTEVDLDRYMCPLELHEKLPNGLLISGPSGIGKSLMVNAVCRELGVAARKIQPSDFGSNQLGEDEEKLRRIFQSVEEASIPTIIHMEHIDKMFGSRKRGNQRSVRTVAQLLTLMDGARQQGRRRYCIVATTENPNDIDAALRRPGRFDMEIKLGPPTQQDRADILMKLSRNLPLESDTNFDAIAESTIGFVASDLAALVGHVTAFIVKEHMQLQANASVAHHADIGLGLKMTPLKRVIASTIKENSPCYNAGIQVGDEIVEIDSLVLSTATPSAIRNVISSDVRKPLNIVVSRKGKSWNVVVSRAIQLEVATIRADAEIFLGMIKEVTPSCLRGMEVQIPKTSWDSVGGYEDVKKKIEQCVEWPLIYAETFTRLNIRSSRGLLLYGPPGCCKTTLVRAVASKMKISFLRASGADVFACYLGDSEKIVRELFARARAMTPCVLFLDEIDAVVGTRGEVSDASGIQRRILATFLNEMDGIEQAKGVLVVGATNRPFAIDSALLRPGRFDEVIYLPLPNEQERLDILKVHTKKMPLAQDCQLDWIARVTANYSGAELERLCQEAALCSLRKDIWCEQVDASCFVYALGVVHPNTDLSSLDKLNEFASIKIK